MNLVLEIRKRCRFMRSFLARIASPVRFARVQRHPFAERSGAKDCLTKE